MAATPVLAEKPDGKPDHPPPHRQDRLERPERPEKAERQEREWQAREHRYAAQGPMRFDARQRSLVLHHYAEAGRSARCPPGLAKKGNGCLPPGQARHWSIGRPLPRDQTWHELPPALVLELGPPPELHRYVRVGADILLIAIGSGLVIDAIEDLGRLR
jgi:Ni/Co efflux regulator RcnB